MSETLDPNEPIDPNDPEKGLDKFVDRNNKRRKAEYEENKYRNRELKRRREQEQGKQLEIPGIFEAGSTFRTLAGLGVEIGGNFFLDALSAIPGSQQVGSAGLNYLQQIIRGGPISKGEIAAAALASQIPFLQQARSIKQGGKVIRQAKKLSKGGKFVRGVARGTVAGGIDSTVRPIIDEKRAPTIGEFGTGVTAGGLFGGMFDLAPAFTQGGVKKVGQELSEISQDGQKFLNDIGDTIKRGDYLPGPLKVAIRGDLIGAVADGTGTSSSIRRVPNLFDPNNPVIAPYIGHLTNKFKKQPWEDYLTMPTTRESADRLLTQVTGFPTKLDAPQPKGFVYRLLKSRGKTGKLTGNQPLLAAKQDIDLTSREFNFNTPAQAQKSADSFRRKIIRMMQIDRIRGEDAGTLAGFNRGSSKITTAAGGIKDVGDTYYDYLTGFFNRYIRRGTVDNFDQAIKIKIPKVRGKQILPGVETDIVKGDSSLIRELRLFTINPDVYKSGAFSTQNPTYQSKLKTLMRKYTTVNVTQPNPSMTYNKRRDIFEYKFDAHHINQIAEGWPLFRGLPKEEIPLMRKLIEEFGLEVGNAEENMLLLLNKFHDDYHDIYWPRAYAKLKAHPDGWDIDKIREIQTASGRMSYVERYVQAINESREEVLASVRRNLDELAAQKNKLRADLTEAEIDQIDIDFENLAQQEAPAKIYAQMKEDIGINDVSRWTNYDR